MYMSKHVTDADFEAEVLKSDVPVLVDFYAEWCGPCKALAPVIDELATEYDGKFKVVKMNVDENQNRPQEFGVLSIPTLIFFKGGAEVDRLTGALPKDSLAEKMDAHL